MSMSEKLLRVGTTYLPVSSVNQAAEWYVKKLGATLNYIDDDKAIISLANQSFFLVASLKGETANFVSSNGEKRFSITFEVDGLRALKQLHAELLENGVTTGEIEDRGHAGNNFVFQDLDGNLFDVWSELSPSFHVGVERRL